MDKTTGTIKGRNEWVHTINWDLVIFDEYHFGAWKENAKKLFEQDDEDDYNSENMEQYSRADAYDETWLPITTDHYLYLSGTPFRALNSGEFIEEQIYNWTYSDEQRAKENWQGAHNPYAALPRMVMMTYKIPESIQQIAKQGEYDEFDLNVFFSAKGKGRDCRFVYEDYVQKWLDLIRGSYLETTVDELKLGAKKPALPFADSRLLNVLQHTLWFLPNVVSCYAMANLLADRKNTFYHDYRINVCAGTEAGIGAAALEPVQRSMGDPLATKTITLSCGKLTTGVTVKPWTGIFMLRNLSSPETYFQAAFRVQSPWEVTTDKGQKEIIKKSAMCYFALNRALRQISDYSCRLNIYEGNPEKKVAEFINFLPVIAYDGSSMRQINAGDILDICSCHCSSFPITLHLYYTSARAGQQGCLRLGTLCLEVERGHNRSYSPLFCRSRKSVSVSCKDGPLSANSIFTPIPPMQKQYGFSTACKNRAIRSSRGRAVSKAIPLTSGRDSGATAPMSTLFICSSSFAVNLTVKPPYQK